MRQVTFLPCHHCCLDSFLAICYLLLSTLHFGNQYLSPCFVTEIFALHIVVLRQDINVKVKLLQLVFRYENCLSGTVILYDQCYNICSSQLHSGILRFEVLDYMHSVLV